MDMRVVNRLRDIRELEVASTVTGPLAGYLRGLLLQLHGVFGGGAAAEEFSLEEVGPLVLLEEGDCAESLREVGPHGTGGLPGLCPEFVERLDLGGTRYYKLGVMTNNEYLVHVFMRADGQDPATLEWLEQESTAFEETVEQDAPEAPECLGVDYRLVWDEAELHNCAAEVLGRNLTSDELSALRTIIHEDLDERTWDYDIREALERLQCKLEGRCGE